MLELVIEILVYLAIAALIGFLLGYLAWGWGLHRKLETARAEGATSVRTSMHGDSAHDTQLAECQKQRKRLELSLERSKDQITDLQAQLDEARASGYAVTETTEEAAQADPDPDSKVYPNDNGEVLDAEIDFDDEPEDPVPAPGGRRLFVNDDIDPRISGIEPEDASTPEPEEAQEPMPEPEPEPEPQDQAVPAVPAAEEIAEPAPVPASLLTERPEEVDDLKEIKGVGVVMEGVLNDKGVYLFHQIANFSAADVAWVNEAIEAFPGRIERDNWVGQAQDLHRTKYGRAHDE